MSDRVIRILKATLVWVMLAAVLLCTTVSVLGIWQVVGNQGSVFRAGATLGVVFFGCAIALAVVTFSQRRLFSEDPFSDRSPLLQSPAHH